MSAGFRSQRIGRSFFFHNEERLVGLCRAWTLQAFTGAALVIINCRQIVIARHVVQKNRSCFAAALESHIEFWGSFGERPSIEIRTPEIEMPKPGIANFLRLLKDIHGLAGISLLELRFTSNQFSINLRFRFHTLPKWTGKRQSARFLSRG